MYTLVTSYKFYIQEFSEWQDLLLELGMDNFTSYYNAYDNCIEIESVGEYRVYIIGLHQLEMDYIRENYIN